MPQQRLLEILAAEATLQTNFTFTMGCSVRGLLRDAYGIVGVRAQLHDGESVELRADIVVGCDGRFSAVRRTAGIE